jgi:ubiquinone/menaquinone biosynthesis C-methylase UbiE
MLEPETSKKHADYERFSDEYIEHISSSQSLSNNYFNPVWKRVIPNIAEIKKLLDIGCGTGLFSLFAHLATNCELYGVDGSSHALEIAKKSGFQHVYKIEDFDRYPLPFEDNVFDFCLCKDVLEHLINPLWVLTEAYRVMKRNGHLLVHVPNQFSVFSRIKFLITNNIDTKNYFPQSKQWNYPHIRFFTHNGFSDLLRQTGFRLVDDHSCIFSAIPYGRYLIPIASARESIVARYPSQLSEGFTFLVQKQ